MGFSKFLFSQIIFWQQYSSQKVFFFKSFYLYGNENWTQGLAEAGSVLTEMWPSSGFSCFKNTSPWAHVQSWEMPWLEECTWQRSWHKVGFMSSAGWGLFSCSISSPVCESGLFLEIIKIRKDTEHDSLLDLCFDSWLCLTQYTEWVAAVSIKVPVLWFLVLGTKFTWGTSNTIQKTSTPHWEFK